MLPSLVFPVLVLFKAPHPHLCPSACCLTMSLQVFHRGGCCHKEETYSQNWGKFFRSPINTPDRASGSSGTLRWNLSVLSPVLVQPALARYT